MSRKAVEDVMRIEVEIMDATRGVSNARPSSSHHSTKNTNTNTNNNNNQPTTTSSSNQQAQQQTVNNINNNTNKPKVVPPRLDLQQPSITNHPINSKFNQKSPVRSSRSYTNSNEIYPPIASNVDIVTKKYTYNRNTSSTSLFDKTQAQSARLKTKDTFKSPRSTYQQQSSRQQTTQKTSPLKSRSPPKERKQSSSIVYSPPKSRDSSRSRPHSSPPGRRSTTPKPVRDHPSHIINTNVPLFTPGPGAYEVDKSSKYLRPSTAISMSRNSRFKETKFETPSPHTYNPEKPLKRMPSPRFGSSKRPDSAKSVSPGPIYDVNDNALSKVKNTPRFSFPLSPRDLDVENRTPSPGTYSPNYSATMRKSVTVVFPKSPKQERTKSTTPGPGIYDVPSGNKQKKEPAFSFAKSDRHSDKKSVVDNQYDVAWSSFSPKGVSKFGSTKRFSSQKKNDVPFHQSQTEWKKTQAGKFGKDRRALNDINSSKLTPGPGYYQPNYTVTLPSSSKPVLYLTG